MTLSDPSLKGLIAEDITHYIIETGMSRGHANNCNYWLIFFNTF